jgi:hypothetical protein
MGRTAIGIIFFLFVLCFVAIVVEELFLAGRRRRVLERRIREERLRDSHKALEEQCD